MERSNYQSHSPMFEGGVAAEREFYKVQIIGDSRFTKRTQRALRLLEDRAPDYYDIV